MSYEKKSTVLVRVDSKKSLLERFCEKWRDNPVTGCWDWVAGKNTKGYGKFGSDGATTRAHRWVWEFINGPVPGRLKVLHKCKQNRACCNPDHLYLGTQLENAADREADGTTFKGTASRAAKANRGGSSKHPGVYSMRRTGKWRTQMRVGGKKRQLGLFSDESRAGQRYQEVHRALARLEELSDHQLKPEELAARLARG